MPSKRELTLKQIDVEAKRVARFCFDLNEQQRWRHETEAPELSSFSVIIANRFVPFDSMPESIPVIRRYSRGISLKSEELTILKQFWSQIDADIKRLCDAHVLGCVDDDIRSVAEQLTAWPAVNFAQSENVLYSLLLAQLERIRDNHISWNRAESSTYPYRINNGVYLIIDWSRHG